MSHRVSGTITPGWSINAPTTSFGPWVGACGNSYVLVSYGTDVSRSVRMETR